MKSIILSVNPHEAVNILNGEQTIIIKKSAPKETPFKVYLYCTKGKKGVIFKSGATNEIRLGFERDNSKEVIDILNKSGRQVFNGKVVLEYVVNKIEKLYYTTTLPKLIISHGIDIKPPTFDGEEEVAPFYNGRVATIRNSCLTQHELLSYGKGKTLYGWHISDLKVYDELKDLDNFTCVCRTSKRCGESKICSSSQKCFYDKLTKPPATWVHVNIFKPN